MYAQFFDNEAAARQALDAWVEGVRKDWDVKSPWEVIRTSGKDWDAGAVHPADQARVAGRTLRLLRAEARGPFARWGEDNKGTAKAAFEVCFPKESQA